MNDKNRELRVELSKNDGDEKGTRRKKRFN